MPWKRLIVFCLALLFAACGSSSTPSSPAGSPPTADLRIPVGQSIQVTVGLNEPVTSVPEWEDYRARVVQVTAAEPQTALVRVVSATETDARPARWRILNAAILHTACCTFSWQSIHQVTVTISQPVVLQVELIIPVEGPAETFTVTTSRVAP